MSNITRKRKPNQPGISRKKAKLTHLTAGDLPWKTVPRPREAEFGADYEDLLDLEEVDDVEVLYEETDAGRVVRFMASAASKGKSKDTDVLEEPRQDVPEDSSPAEEPPALPTSTAKAARTPEAPSFDAAKLLPHWHEFSLHPRLSYTLYTQGFTNPTPIQSQALPLAMQGRDIVGVAETGSGKTLAYGLPILHHLLTEASAPGPSKTQGRRPLRALILAPTRELALQVSTHLNACLNDIDIPAGEPPSVEEDLKQDNSGTVPANKSKGKSRAMAKKIPKPNASVNTPGGPVKPKPPPLVSVAAIVGGMSAQKQRRILSRGVDVLVATPGRLWDIVQEDDQLGRDIERLRFLVLDEADRMIETGHFAEMDNVLRLTMRFPKEGEPELEPDVGLRGSAEPEDSKKDVKKGDLQTFVFSATLSKDLQRNLKRPKRPKKQKNNKPASTLDDLLLRLDFRDPTPAVIDISPAGGVVATLQESKVECLALDKDAYLYYFLLRYPGRTLVFLSSIDGIRRLLPLLDLLGLPAFPLHSQLEQRQRLKNLDRFKSTPNAILLATDVAARGLDVPAVDHVVHYQAPRAADAYVHRNGRTARAMRRGFSLLLCAPDERRVVRAMLGSLGRQEEDIPEMPVDLYLLDKLKARIQLARGIDTAQHKVRKEKHERNWLKEAAEAMEIELDSDLDSPTDDDARNALSKRKLKAAEAKTAALKAELKQLLAQPLVARGISTRYITSGSRPVADEMLAGELNEQMVGLRKVEAGSDLVPAKKRKAKAKTKEEFEEWNGLGE
ncbi:DEAD-domain-containing protein [Obba rivulosa]|uniref:ATP-dependent RNA helicase n=1 Tax=Obba rivulosa TaxID=1052685 RepID=A0A8E2AWT1_9APHY|nr:DEAD-domain-containing protein [Obba rivulosa]